MTTTTIRNKNILITGIAGLIGSRLADWIIKNHHYDYNIIGIDNLSGGMKTNIPKNCKFYNIDLIDSEKLNNIFKENQIDYVYHFAAYAAEGLSPFIRNFNYNNNLISTINLVNCCINYNIEKIVFTSSMAVYGNNEIPYSETQIPNPIDPYGVAKYACEMDIRIAGDQHNLNWTIIRPHNVFGINQNIFDMYRNVIGIWLYQSLNNLPISIYGDGEQTRAFSLIDDCMLPLWKSMFDERSDKQIINLGGTKSITINEVAKLISSITNNKNIIYLEGRHEIKNAIPTFQKSIDLLDYSDNTDFKKTVEEMYNWTKTLKLVERHKWENYEVVKGIYQYWK